MGKLDFHYVMDELMSKFVIDYRKILEKSAANGTVPEKPETLLYTKKFRPLKNHFAENKTCACWGRYLDLVRDWMKASQQKEAPVEA